MADAVQLTPDMSRTRSPSVVNGVVGKPEDEVCIFGRDGVKDTVP